MATVRWDPLADLLALRRDVDRLFRKAGFDPREAPHAEAWNPPVDLLRRGRDLVVRIELPGVDVRDVDLTVGTGTLTVRGERRVPAGADEVLVQESETGSFARHVLIPEPTDAAGLRAEYRGGVLEVTVPGGATDLPTPQRVEIRTAPAPSHAATPPPAPSAPLPAQTVSETGAAGGPPAAQVGRPYAPGERRAMPDRVVTPPRPASATPPPPPTSPEQPRPPEPTPPVRRGPEEEPGFLSTETWTFPRD